jgi:aminopeptidase N
MLTAALEKRRENRIAVAGGKTTMGRHDPAWMQSWWREGGIGLVVVVVEVVGSLLLLWWKLLQE